MIGGAGNSYAGEWADGRRNGLGRETHGRWVYHGEWSTGVKGRYGVRRSAVSRAKYEGSWVGGVQDGFGVETYSDCSQYIRCRRFIQLYVANRPARRNRAVDRARQRSVR